MGDTDNEGRCPKTSAILHGGLLHARRCVLDQPHVRRRLPHCYEAPSGVQVYIALSSEEQVLG